MSVRHFVVLGDFHIRLANKSDADIPS